MEGRIRGSFPGGPGRSEGPSDGRDPPRLERAEEFEARQRARVAGRGGRKRRRRVAVGFIVSVLVAGGAGLVLGVRSARTAEELQEEQARAARPLDAQISREVNRTLLQLWKMEDVEALRNTGRSR